MPLRPAPTRAPPFLSPAAGGRARRQCFSTTRLRARYADTVANLRIGPHTRVLYQGFTGKQATVNAQQSLAYGTQIVGGVTPGRTGEHLGLPVLPSVRAAAADLRPDATAIFVAATHAPRAIEEAVEAEIPLVVAVAEHIPVHDMLRVSRGPFAFGEGVGMRCGSYGGGLCRGGWRLGDGEVEGG
jgi:succinyl-CoA synthetase alpha subunit